MATAIVRRTRVVRVPGRTRTRIVQAARRVGSAGARAARDQRHMFYAAAAAGALGYASRPGGIELPHIQALGVAGTYGLVAAGLAMAKIGGETVRHAATGLLCAAIYDYMKTPSAPATSGYADDIDE